MKRLASLVVALSLATVAGAQSSHAYRDPGLASQGQQVPYGAARIDYSTALSRGLVGMWLLNEYGGATIYDISGYRADGVMTNMDPATDWVISSRGSALAFSQGTGEYANILGTPALPGDWTVAIWVNPDDVDINQYISDFSDGNETAVILGFQDGYYNIFGGSYATGTASDTQMAASGVGIWDFVVWTRTGANLKGFVNGGEKVSVTITVGDFSPSAGFRIGRNFRPGGDASSFGGLIGGAAVYSRALLPSEIWQFYQDSSAMLVGQIRVPFAAIAAAAGGVFPFVNTDRLHSLVDGGFVQ